MSILINIILILASLVLMVVVLMQEGNKQGLGAIGGAAETFLGKNKAKSYEGKLLNITRVAAVVFVVLAILATWLNARTFSVTYYDENGKEFFAYLNSNVESQNYFSSLSGDTAVYTYEQEYAAAVQSYKDNGSSEKELKEYLRDQTSFKDGAEIFDHPTPSKVGYTGVWVIDENGNHLWDEGEDTPLPKKMDGKKYSVVPMYTINQYTITVVDNGVLPEAEPAAEETAAEGEEVQATADEQPTEATEAAEVTEPAADNVLFTLTADYGTAIEYPAEVRSDLPLREGDNYVFYSTDKSAVADGFIYNIALPETMPAGNATYYVCYAKGGFLSYMVEQNEYQDVVDEEGNPVLDENGNVKTEPVVDENGEQVKTEKEWFPGTYSDIYQAYLNAWDSEYAAAYGDDYESYFADMTAALSGDLGTLIGAQYTQTVETYADNPEVIRDFVPFGTELTLSEVPVAAPEGKVAEWYSEDGELPEIMDGKDYVLHVRFVDAPVEEETTEETAETEEVVETTEEAADNAETADEAAEAPADAE